MQKKDSIDTKSIDLIMEHIVRLAAMSEEILEKQIRELEKVPKSKTAGHLVKCSQNGKVHWRKVLSPNESDSGRKEVLYLGKADEQQIILLANKLYTECSLYVRKSQLMAIRSFTKKIGQITQRRLRVINDEDIRNLLKAPESLQEKIEKWKNSEYTGNPGYPEGLNVHTIGGLKVRSKSEAIIAAELNRKNIPFRYECALTLRNTTVYPDFTICHPVTGKLYLWEHMGLMDESRYAASAARKLEDYILCGYIPMINLILTSETKNHPLDYSLVRMLIEHFFELSV